MLKPRFSNSVVNFANKIRRSLQDFPYYGTTEACDSETLADGWTVIDVEKKQLRIHDGKTPGGAVIPNMDDVESMIANVESLIADTEPTTVLDPATSLSLGGVIQGPGNIIDTTGKLFTKPNGLRYDLPKWRKALAGAVGGVAPASIAFYGGSHQVGQGTSTGPSGLTGASRTNPAAILANQLSLGKYRISNDAFMGYHALDAASVNLDTYDPRIVTTPSGAAGWKNAGGTITAGGACLKATNVGDVITYSPKLPWKTVDVWIPRASTLTGTFDVVPQGGATTSLSNTNATSSYTKYTITAATEAVQTLSITCTSNPNVCSVGAVIFHSSDVGQVDILQCGQCGKNAANLAVQALTWDPLNSLFAYAPALTIIEIFDNDVIQATSPAAWLASMQTIINKMKAVGDIIVCGNFPGSHANYTNGQASTMLTLLVEWLDAQGINWIDWQLNFGATWAIADTAGLLYDTVHFNGFGSGLCALRHAQSVQPWI